MFLESYIHLYAASVHSATVKGFVATPTDLANQIVELLFDEQPPAEGDRVLYPGVGRGPFIEAVHNYCEEHGYPVPTGYACDTHEERLIEAKKKYSSLPVTFKQEDFLDRETELGTFEYIVGNPPYVPITQIDEELKQGYRMEYETATGRFDLYLLFFERALNLLRSNGRLAFITPEKFEYTKTASPLRRLLGEYHLEQLIHLEESAFTGYTTYPTISVIQSSESGKTTIVPRDGTTRRIQLPTDGTRWTEFVRDIESTLSPTGVTLGEITQRISAGVATGADSVYVFGESDLPDQLNPWSKPTISGKQLEQQSLEEPVGHPAVFVCPYDDQGSLIPESELGAFGDWLNSIHRSRLEERSCYQNGKRAWYAWHENPPMTDILGEKILFRDITDTPRFWLDTDGSIVPRHSVYYLIPKHGIDIRSLQTYLNSPPVSQWLHANCQRARNDYLRLQSRILEDLPVPEKYSTHRQVELDSITK